VSMALGASPAGNWEGTNVLWRPVPVAAVAAELDIDHEELERTVADARTVLFEARAGRVHPATDDKVLTAWNALAIRALAEAGRSFAEPTYVEAAERCATFVWEHLRDDRGRLLRSWRNGTQGGPGFADDHALLAVALLTLYETTADVTWFVRAREIADELLRLFRDEERGGFFQTGADAEQLVVRPKELYDNAVPSGNSAAAEMLLRLSLFTGEALYEEAAVSALSLVGDVLSRAPTGFGHALCALDLLIGPAMEVAIVGERDDPSTLALLDEVLRVRYLPNVVLALSEPTRAEQEGRRVPLLSSRTPSEGGSSAFVCQRLACLRPVSDPAALAEQLMG